MHQVLIGLAILLSVAIIAIGVQYIAAPGTAARSFGLPLPGESLTIASWLRLKGVRDIASGLAVLSSLAWGEPQFAGVVLLALATIPVGDMLVVLAGQGSSKRAFGIHGVTAIVMAITGISLVARTS